MTAREIIEQAAASGLDLGMAPPATAEQLATLEGQLPGPLPAEMRDVLALTTGIAAPAPLGTLRLLDPSGGADMPPYFPWAYSLGEDAEDDWWAVDVNPATGSFGPVLYVSQKPPVIVVQAPSVAAFVAQVVDARRGKPDPVARARAEAARIWDEDPFLLGRDDPRVLADDILRRFAERLDPDRFRVVDLRPLEIGSGFAWGRSRRTPVLRYRLDLIFAVPRPPSFLGRFLARRRGPG